MPLIAGHEIDPRNANAQIYNGFDCCGTHGILSQLLKLPGQDIIYNFERGMQGVALEMSLRGIRVDPVAREQAIKTLKAQLHEIDEEFLIPLSIAICDKTINYDSGAQIKDILYNHLHIPAINKKDPKTQKIVQPMDAETLEKLCKYKLALPLCKAILLCRDLDSQIEKLEMEVDNDWRIRYSNNVAGTNEGRWSTSKSAIGTGGNVQNITESVRHIFISDDGYKLAGIDKEQAESRWVGFLCGILFNDWSYLDALESGDGHTYVARLVWEKEKPWTGDLKKDRIIAEQPFGLSTFRQTCKVLAHGTNIMGKPRTLSTETKIPLNLVEDFQEKYFNAFPVIPKYHTWIANELQTKHYLTNPFGRRRDFFGRSDSDDIIRKGCAFMQASPNADDINLGLNRVWKLMGHRIQLLTQEHDAIYFQFKETENEMELVQEIQSLLINEFDLGFRKFSVPTDAKTGWNKGLRWHNGEETNPRGLDKLGAKR